MSRVPDDAVDVFLAETTGGDAGAIDVLAQLAGELAPSAPSPAARARLLEAAAERGRFDRFAEAVAELLTMDYASALAVLDRMERADDWLPLLPAARTLPVPVGPALADTWRAAFMRIRAGGCLPDHEHFGRERSLVLQGHCVESGDPARIVGPGEVIDMAPASSHAVRVCDGPDLLVLAVVEHGFAAGDLVVGRKP